VTSSADVAVVFDIDDTLYLERDYVRSGFAAVGRLVRERVGMPDFAERAWAAFADGARGTIFDDVLAGYAASTSPALTGELVECYRNHDPAIELLADARAVLDHLAGPTGRTGGTGRAAVAVVTDGPLASQKAKARTLGLDRWAEPVVFTEELGPDWVKPSPRAFALMEQRLGVPGAACVYVADNPAKDFAGPKQRGWRTVRIRRPLGLHAGAESSDLVDVELPDLALGPFDRFLADARG
jgi:putative hydrolase of the HAD superfamily